MTTIVTLHPVSGHEMSRAECLDLDEAEAGLQHLRVTHGAGYVMRDGRIISVACCVKGEIPEPTERYAKMLARDVMADWRMEVRL